MGDFKKALQFTFKREGGFSNYRDDPGGPTNYGITHKDFERAKREKLITCKSNDVRDLTREQARTIYHEYYWKPIRGDELPQDLATALFDTHVLFGQQAIGWLQEIMKVSKGAMTDKTLQAIRNYKGDLIDGLLNRRWLRHQERMKEAPEQGEHYGRGWAAGLLELYALLGRKPPESLIEGAKRKNTVKTRPINPPPYLLRKPLAPSLEEGDLVPDKSYMLSPQFLLPKELMGAGDLPPDSNYLPSSAPPGSASQPGSTPSGRGLPGIASSLPPAAKRPAGVPPSAPVKPYSLKDKLDFLGDVHRFAKPISDETGLSLPMVLAQAAYETGWGRRVDGNNLFNLKAGENWEGPTTVRGETAYRAYPSRKESMNDYLAFLHDNPSFGHMFDPDATGSLEKLATALQQGGYTDDPAYGIKIRETASAPTFRHALSILGNSPRGDDGQG